LKGPWRPEGWVNPYLDALIIDKERILFRLPDGGIYIEGQGREIGTNAYEEGATAILEALFKMAKKSPTDTFIIDPQQGTFTIKVTSYIRPVHILPPSNIIP